MGVPEEDLPRPLWLGDPVVDLKPIVFALNNPAWCDPGKAGLLSDLCAPTGSGEPTTVSPD
ncbi:hypothetical protein [Poseidonocella sedimentorum]|uniref:Uncharacterized protein n=1 Tax=Poseidonocella sedimentorum TaxID=871652 RepID=A0A1I6EDN3_9RHOB|nr:hypothetical protein [Poseidonocella sedimentorum]SFR15767.1 hypothetical protein SAMN04515673_11049 [Poseidonocella sedimentorum]